MIEGRCWWPAQRPRPFRRRYQTGSWRRDKSDEREKAAREAPETPVVAGQGREAPSPLAARLVPYGFARSGQILVAHQHADSIEVWISERTNQAALAEVARNFGAISVVRLSADGVQRFTQKDGLTDDTVSALYEDSIGTLWIGTSNGGLNRFSRGQFSHFNAKDGFSGGGVQAIFEGREGNLWIGSTDGGLNSLREGVFATVSRQEGLASDGFTARVLRFSTCASRIRSGQESTGFIGRRSEAIPPHRHRLLGHSIHLLRHSGATRQRRTRNPEVVGYNRA